MRRSNPARVVVGFAAGLLLAVALPRALAAALAWAPPESLPPVTSVQQLDARIDTLRKGVWGIYQREYTEAPDVRGRTLKQDVDDYLMVPATVTHLEALHARAQAEESAHKSAALKKTLDEATVLVQLEVYHDNLLNDYWYRQTRVIEQKQVYDALMARMPAASRPDEAPAIKAAYQAAATQLTAALAAASPTVEEQKVGLDKLHEAITAIYAIYTSEREALGMRVGIAERKNGVAPLALARTEPCPPAPAPGADAQPPPAGATVVKPARFAPNNHADELFYPPQLRRLDLEGLVVVATTVSASGCATKAEVYAPSGAQAFDESALKWALQASYLPGERDGKPVESVMRMGVRFKMR